MQPRSRSAEPIEALLLLLGACLFVLWVFWADDACASEHYSVAVHGLALHYDEGDKYTDSYNNHTYGVGINYRSYGDGYHVGGYRNSYGDPSLYVGVSRESCYQTMCGGVIAFAATGYPQGPLIPMLGATIGARLMELMRLNVVLTPVVSELSLEVRIR